ncbi:MAG: TRAP transporter small permease [Burkholderiales bacterium]
MKLLERLLGVVAGFALFAMMALTFVDVIGRKLAGTSFTGSVELTELFMLAVIFAAMPLTSLHGEHVLFDLLDHFLPASLKAVQHRLSNLICTALLSGGAWLVLQRAARAAEDGDRTAQLGMSVSNFHYATAGLLIVTALVHFVLAVRATPESDAFHPPVLEDQDA